MQIKRIHYGFAALSFLIALITYTATMQPSIPFWDCGEFAASAQTLSIGHPPGAPLWHVVGRIALMIPTFSDPVARYNFFSVLASAVSIMLLYLIVARLIRFWRGEPKSTADVITHYGGAFIAALAYTWTDSFWFNALECEVYAFGSLFISLVPWLILVWHDHADEDHSEKWLLLIFYVIGLSMGVHQLALLTIFPVIMLVYYKRWPSENEFQLFGRSFGKWWAMVGVSVLIFVFAFVVVLSKIVTWFGSDMWWLSILVLGGLIGGIIWSQREKNAIVNLFCWAMILLFVGFSTYGMIMDRAAKEPPMNQWHASNFNILHQYIDRAQYGEFHWSDEWEHRRLPQQKSEHAPTWDENKYSSDGDFFWKYQTNHMFLRYLYWNFIGRANDNQDADWDFSKTWALPFVIGLFGMFWHFKRDPKRAFTLLGMFIVLGFVTAWYQNQQDPQPRERDYFYVGAFYVFAMWVGIGATGLMEIVRARFATKSEAKKGEEEDSVPIVLGDGPLGMLAGVFALVLIIGPINQVVGLAGLAQGQPFTQSSKWAEYSRRHNYVPFEYAYNILQSCDKDAILFTAGDNDTFPLWCIQDVYGIRRDVRIVNLSLGNMGWYIKQLKDKEPWGAKRLKLPSFTEDMLNHEDDKQGGVQYDFGDPTPIALPISGAGMQWLTHGATSEPVTMNWTYTGQMQQQGKQIFTVADQLVKDIVMNNIESRPIYFASAVPQNYSIGLEGFLVYEGLAARVMPFQHAGERSPLDGEINEKLYTDVVYTIPAEPSLTPARGMVLNTYRDPGSRHSALDDHYGAQTYFITYGRLANHYIKQGKMEEAKRALDTLDARVPPELVDYESQYLQVLGDFFARVGEMKKAARYTRLASAKISADGSPKDQDGNNRYLNSQFQMGDLFLRVGELDSAKACFGRIRGVLQEGSGDRAVVDFKLGMIDAKLAENHGDKKTAVAKYDEIINKFGPMLGQTAYGQEVDEAKKKRDTLARAAGIAPRDPAADSIAKKAAEETQLQEAVRRQVQEMNQQQQNQQHQPPPGGMPTPQPH